MLLENRIRFMVQIYFLVDQGFYVASIFEKLHKLMPFLNINFNDFVNVDGYFDRLCETRMTFRGQN